MSLLSKIRAATTAIASVRPATTAGALTSRTSRGFTVRPKPARARSGPVQMDIPDWADTGWDEGEIVVRRDALTAPASAGNAIDDGRKAGTWIATQNIPAGTDAAGPSLDNSKWRPVAVCATEKIVYRKGNQRITIDVGRDADDGFGSLPRIIIESHTAGTGARIELPLSLCNGKRIYPQELGTCEIDEFGDPQTMHRMFICSDPY